MRVFECKTNTLLHVSLIKHSCYILTSTAANFGYALFFPSAAAEELSFDVTTNEGGTINAKSQSTTKYAAANAYAVTITFSFSKVAASAGEGSTSGLGSFGGGGVTL
ncbi:MAG: hypothetical protein LBU44_04735 [Mediterranea sp.]|jgi:hypothetical protein|nr:hypothetical protein [Mediterranea sp.]